MKSIIDYVALGPGFPSWNNLTSVPLVEPSHKFSGLTIQNTFDRFCMEPLGRFARVASFPDARRHAQNYSRTSRIRRCLDIGRHSLSPILLVLVIDELVFLGARIGSAPLRASVVLIKIEDAR